MIFQKSLLVTGARRSPDYYPVRICPLFLNNFLKSNTCTSNTSFISFLKGNHWNAALIDFANAEISFIDPIGEDTERFSHYLKRWEVYFMKTIQSDAYTKWTWTNLKHKHQTDFINCGPWCCYILSYLIEKKQIDNFQIESFKETSLDIFEFRRFMSHSIQSHFNSQKMLNS